MSKPQSQAKRSAEALRALRLAAGIHRPHWPRLVLAVGLLVAILAGYGLAVALSARGPVVRAYGKVLTVNVSADDSGPHIRARVWTADGERTLSLPTSWVCWPGDRIEVYRRGKRYGPGLAGCTRP